MSQQAIDRAESALSAAYVRVVDRHSVAGALQLARAAQMVALAYLEDGQLNRGMNQMMDASNYYLEAKDIESSAHCFDQVAQAYEMAGNSAGVQTYRRMAADRRRLRRNP